MSDTNPAAGKTAGTGGRPPSPRATTRPDAQSRYVVELAGGGSGRAVYEVLDKTLHPKRRMICRTNRADALMIAAALNR